MAKNNQAKEVNGRWMFLTGVVLIIIAFVMTGAMVYLMGYRQQIIHQEISSYKEELKKMAAQIFALKEEALKAGEIKLSELVRKAKRVYGSEEKERKEGVLWIDREHSVTLATLGALNGLKPGDQLSVYDGDNKITNVVVDKTLDVISYVQPIDDSVGKLESNSYRVVIEK